MRLATYSESSADARLGVVAEDGARVLDIRKTAIRLKVDDSLERILASMQSLIEAGPEGLDQVRDVSRRATDDEWLDARNVRFKAPLPRPMQLRDCLSFEKHLSQVIEQHARLLSREAADPEARFHDLMASDDFKIADVWYEQPIYYKGNRFSVIGHEEDIKWPRYSKLLDYELEFAVVIGAEGANITKADADRHIFGYMIYNDVSARDAQFREMPGKLGPAKGKDFDTGNVMGPWIVTPDEIDPYDMTMIARVNGEEWSRGNSGEIHHRFDTILAHISQDETLYPGEVIGSGTVGSGCGAELNRWLQPNDIIELEVSGLGLLRNRVLQND